MNDKIDLSIVIVSYNVREYILNCLKSVFEFVDDAISKEIIVVDNNSSDNTVEHIEKDFPEVRIIRNSTNNGFPAANNQAFEICKGEFILMLNPDTEIINASANKLFYFIKDNPDVSIVGPKILNSDRTWQQSIWRFPKIKYIFADSFYLRFIIRDKYYKDKNLNLTLDVDSVSGSVLMFRQDLLKSIGGLDENLFWIEDVDFCFKAKEHNLRVVYYPESTFVHHLGKSVTKNYSWAYYNKIFNYIKYYKKHYSKFQYCIVWLISFIHVIYKQLLFWLLAPFNDIYFQKAKAFSFTFCKFFFK